MRKTLTIVLLAFTAVTFSSEVKPIEKESIENPTPKVEWCHVQVDCDGDNVPDYWGDVDCEFEDALRDQYNDSCTGPEIPTGQQ